MAWSATANDAHASQTCARHAGLGRAGLPAAVRCPRQHSPCLLVLLAVRAPAAKLLDARHQRCMHECARLVAASCCACRTHTTIDARKCARQVGAGCWSPGVASMLDAPRGVLRRCGTGPTIRCARVGRRPGVLLSPCQSSPCHVQTQEAPGVAPGQLVRRAARHALGPPRCVGRVALTAWSCCRRAAAGLLPSGSSDWPADAGRSPPHVVRGRGNLGAQQGVRRCSSLRVCRLPSSLCWCWRQTCTSSSQWSVARQAAAGWGWARWQWSCGWLQEWRIMAAAGRRQGDGQQRGQQDRARQTTAVSEVRRRGAASRDSEVDRA